MLFGFTRIQRRHIPGFQRGSSPTASRIVCERPEKASTGSPAFPTYRAYRPLRFHSPAPNLLFQLFPVEPAKGNLISVQFSMNPVFPTLSLLSVFHSPYAA